MGGAVIISWYLNELFLYLLYKMKLDLYSFKDFWKCMKCIIFEISDLKNSIICCCCLPLKKWSQTYTLLTNSYSLRIRKCIRLKIKYAKRVIILQQNNYRYNIIRNELKFAWIIECNRSNECPLLQMYWLLFSKRVVK